MRALLFVPVLMGCALVVGGFTSGSSPMIGIGFGLAGISFVTFVGLKISDSSAARAERLRIWKTGRVATAKVIAIVEARGDADEIPEVDLDLDLGGSQVKVRSLISRLAVPRVQPGCEIQVWVDPADGKKILIDPKLTPYRMD